MAQQRKPKRARQQSPGTAERRTPPNFGLSGSRVGPTPEPRIGPAIPGTALPDTGALKLEAGLPMPGPGGVGKFNPGRLPRLNLSSEALNGLKEAAFKKAMAKLAPPASNWLEATKQAGRTTPMMRGELLKAMPTGQTAWEALVELIGKRM